MTKVGALKAGDRFVVGGESFVVTDLPEAERVDGEVHAESETPGRGGFWFHAGEEV